MSYTKIVLPLIGVLAFFSLAAAGCNTKPGPTSPTVSDVLEVMDADSNKTTPDQEETVNKTETESDSAMALPDKEGIETETVPEMVVEESDPDESTLDEEEIVKAPTVKTFEMIARQWDFEPATIRVNEGDTVVINVKSVDVAHGLAISAFGVNETIEPGTVTKIEFIADKKGTYSYVCSVFCGSGHGGMKGTLIVE